MDNIENSTITTGLVSEIKQLIDSSKSKIAVTVNSEMTLLYWTIGKRIKEEIDSNGGTSYGKNMVQSISSHLVTEYGSSLSEKNLRRMIQFAEVFPEEKIVVSLIRQLSWTHILAIIPIENKIKRDFYIELCKHERWSVRTFRERINSMLFERTAMSKKPEETIINDIESLRDQGKLSTELVFRDPYLLDFLGLKETYSERDLESSILVELQSFIVEIGSDFAFLARQKRISIDNDDYYIDLLFYHRRLKCLIAIDLKIGKFEASHKGQMELYLRWLERHEMIEGENNPIGLILCSYKNEEHIELLQLDKSNIKVAEYLTELPQIKVLERKLHESILRAKEKLAQKAINDE